MEIIAEKVTLKNFNTFKTQISNELKSLKKIIEHTSTDSEKNIEEIEINVTNILSNIEEKESEISAILDNILEYSTQASKKLEEIKISFSEINDTKTELDNTLKETNDYKESLFGQKEHIDKSVIEVEEKIEVINTFLETSKELPTQLDTIQELLNESKEIHETINNLKTHSVNKKSDIDNLYREIYGEDILNDDTKEEEHIDGLKDKLKSTYIKLSEDIKSLDTILDTNIKNNKTAFEKLLTTSQEKFEDVKITLDSLLPGAMSAGLSSAYEDKTLREEESKKSLERSFGLSIIGLVLVSLIPILVDIYLLVKTNATLVQVIKDTPNLIISIFPIYVPILWYAYSSNKKLNLSKRLIEEYTHKASLGKTFEGLSTQIETLQQDDIRDELRSRLLFNLLSASAENPGELIKDYQKSDHPIMEAVENNPITKILSKKSNNIDKETSKEEIKHESK